MNAERRIMSQRQRLPIEVLFLDAEVQPRETMSSAVIKDYAALYRDGHELDPIVVFRDGQDHWVADGFHRTTGAREAGLTEINAEVHEGTQRDAILYSCGANKQGKARTNDDKRRAVDRVLKDLEWRANGNRWVARHCGVDEKYVRGRLKLLSADDPQITKPDVRLVERGGTTYEMDTTKIGMHTQEPLVDEPPDDMDRAAIEASFPRQALTPQPTVTAVPVDEVCLIEAPALILTSPPGEPPPGKKTLFNRTNAMVDWAWWTCNPVTGCLHDCPYCYARDIAERLYPEKFQPTFHPDRLTAPYYTPLPAQAAEDSRANSVFVGSMADLFGKWVPQAWIDAVLTQVRNHPQWNFLVLTKFPQRLAAVGVTSMWKVGLSCACVRCMRAPVRRRDLRPNRSRSTSSSMFVG
jgi:hypothetical protein